MSLMGSLRTAPTTAIPSTITVPHGFLPEFVLQGALNSVATNPLIADKDTYTKDLQLALDDARKLHQVRQQHGTVGQLLQAKQKRKAKGEEADTDAAGYEPGKDANKTESFIYTANNGMSLPGTTLWRDWEDPAQAKDPDVPFLAGKMKNFVDYLKKVYNYESIDNKFYDLHFTMHYGRRYNNAFWNNRQMVTGDGDGVAFDAFHKDEDVVFHEIGHGLTEYNAGSKFREDHPNLAVLAREDGSWYVVDPATGLVFGGLDYYGESGALNESYSDIFAVASRVYGNGQKISQMKDLDWCLGAVCMIGNNKDGTKSSIRHFSKRPGYNNALGKDPQPKHMKDFYRGGGDNGGVHYNSGIINHAFFIAANKLAAVNVNETLNDALAPLWFDAQKKLGNQATFKDFARELLTTSKQKFAHRPEVTKAVEEALTEVGVVNQNFLLDLYYRLRSTAVWLPDFLQAKLAEILLGAGSRDDHAH